MCILKKRFVDLQKTIKLFWVPLICSFAAAVVPPLLIITAISVVLFGIKYISYAMSPCPQCKHAFFGLPAILSGTCYSMINDTWKCNSCGKEIGDR